MDGTPDVGRFQNRNDVLSIIACGMLGKHLPSRASINTDLFSTFQEEAGSGQLVALLNANCR